MTRARTNAALLTASVADLHEQLGRQISGGVPKFGAGDHRYSVDDVFFRDMAIDSVVRPLWNVPVAPETPEVNAIRLDWQETEDLIGTAYRCFCKHRNSARFRAEVDAIVSLSENLLEGDHD